MKEKMARRKLRKFAAIAERENVLEEGKPLYDTIKGNWQRDFFKNTNPITLELACGRGEYATGLAEQFPDRNFIGIDVKGDRLWFGSSVAEEKGLKNVGFLRAHALDLEQFFEEGEVAEIWVVHPDPRPRHKDAKRRLGHHRFLSIYHKLLEKGGWARFKTDDKPLFDFTLQELKAFSIKNLQSTNKLYQSPLLRDHHDIKTRYEKKFNELGREINYAKWQFNDSFAKQVQVLESDETNKEGIADLLVFAKRNTLNPLKKRKVLQKVEQFLSASNSFCYLAQVEGKKIGIVAGYFMPSLQYDSKVLIDKFYVMEGYADKGVEEQLVQPLLNRLEGEGVSMVIGLAPSVKQRFSNAMLALGLWVEDDTQQHSISFSSNRE